MTTVSCSGSVSMSGTDWLPPIFLYLSAIASPRVLYEKRLMRQLVGSGGWPCPCLETTGAREKVCGPLISANAALRNLAKAAGTRNDDGPNTVFRPIKHRCPGCVLVLLRQLDDAWATKSLEPFAVLRIIRRSVWEPGSWPFRWMWRAPPCTMTSCPSRRIHPRLRRRLKRWGISAVVGAAMLGRRMAGNSNQEGWPREASFQASCTMLGS